MFQAVLYRQIGGIYPVRFQTVLIILQCSKNKDPNAQPPDVISMFEDGWERKQEHSAILVVLIETVSQLKNHLDKSLRKDTNKRL